MFYFPQVILSSILLRTSFKQEVEKMSTIHVTYSLSTNVQCPFKCFYSTLVVILSFQFKPQLAPVAFILLQYYKNNFKRLWYEVFSGTSKFVHPGTVRQTLCRGMLGNVVRFLTGFQKRANFHCNISPTQQKTAEKSKGRFYVDSDLSFSLL